MTILLRDIDRHGRLMIFVDGENLAKRYGEMVSGDRKQLAHVVYVPDVVAWTPRLLNELHMYQVVRTHYYTSTQGSDETRDDIVARLRKVGIEAPRVFPRMKGRSSKRVDVTLCTEMLMHAWRGNYSTAVLVAGDEDFVPLVRAVQDEGKRVALWFLESGLSPKLQTAADFFVDIGSHFFTT